MAMQRKTADKKAGSLLLSIFKPSGSCSKSAAKLASKSCDKNKRCVNKACSKAGAVVGSAKKSGCKFYSKTAR